MLAALNTFSFGAFTAHALQLPEGSVPDWTSHWTAELYVQGTLFIACEAIAAASWLSPVYMSIAPLLHIAGLGLLLMWPNQRPGPSSRMKHAVGTVMKKITCTAAIGAAVTVVSVASTLLLGAGILRLSLSLDGVAAGLMTIARIGAAFGRGASACLWSIAAGQTVAAVTGLIMIGRLMPSGWLRRSLVPALTTSAVAVILVRFVHSPGVSRAGALHVSTAAILFAAAVCVTFRSIFGRLLTELFDDLSWGAWPRRLLLLPISTSGEAATIT